MKLHSWVKSALLAAFVLGFQLTALGQTASQTVAPGIGVAVPSGTQFRAEVRKGFDAKKAQVGDELDLQVTEDVHSPSSKVVLIPKKAKLLAKVLSIEPATEKNPVITVSITANRAEWKSGSAELRGRIIAVRSAFGAQSDREGTRYRSVIVMTPGTGSLPVGPMPPDPTMSLPVGLRRPVGQWQVPSVKNGNLGFGSSGEAALPAGTILLIEHRPLFEAYQEAAQKGNAEAQFQLGLMYHQGKGAPQDYAQAAEWYRKAAEQGVGKAQNNLAVLYAQGQGIPQDLVAAHMWFAVAGAAKPDKNQANLQRLESQMTREQLAEAHRRAEEWLRQLPASH